MLCVDRCLREFALKDARAPDLWRLKFTLRIVHVMGGKKPQLFGGKCSTLHVNQQAVQVTYYPKDEWKKTCEMQIHLKFIILSEQKMYRPVDCYILSL